MALGEKIGDAYVRIHGDGSSLDADIRRDLAEGRKGYESEGQKSGQAYQRAFNKARIIESKKHQKEVADALTISRAKMQAVTDHLASDYHKSMKKSMADQIGGDNDEIANVIWRNLEESYRRTANPKVFTEAFKNLPAEIEKATKQITAMEEQNEKDRLAKHKAFLDLRNEMDKTAEAIHKNILDNRIQAEKDAEAVRTRIYKEAYADNAAFDRQRKRQITELGQQLTLLNRETQQAVSGSRDAMRKGELRKLLDDIRVGMERNHHESKLWSEQLRDNDRALRRLHPTLTKSTGFIDNWGDRMGKVFGRGSRNNFLNFIGSMVRGFVRLGSLPMRAIQGFMNLGEAIGDVFKKGAEFGSRWGNLASKVAGSGAVFATSGVGLLAVAAGLAAIITVAGAVASAISLIAGAVTAMVASLAFATAGLGAGLVAVFAPMAAGALIAAAAFMGLSDAQKKALKADVKPITQAFKGLQEVARKPIFGAIEGWAKDLGPVIDNLQGSVRGMSEALVRVGDSVVAGLKGNMFAKWADDVGRFMSGTEDVPGAIERVGDIAQNALGGVGGLFRGMIPFMRDALEWLSDLTQRFSDWANSVKGQKQIGDFFDRAAESLKHVGHFAEEAFGFVADLLNAGKGTGDSIFESMADKIAEWRDALAKDPDILKRWFADAQEFARQLGRAAENAGKIFDALDDEGSRANVTSFLSTTATTLETISKWTDRIQFGKAFLTFDPKGMLDAFSPEKILPALEAFQDFSHKVAILANGVQEAVKAALIPGGESPMDAFVRGMDEAAASFSDLETKGSNAGSLLKGVFGDAKGAIMDAVGAVQKLPDKKFTQIVATGVVDTIGEIKDLASAYKLTPKQVRTLIRTSGVDLTKSEIKNLVKELTNLHNKKTKPKIEADTEPATQDLNTVKEDMLAYQRATYKTTIAAQDNASGTLANIEAAIARLPNEKTINIRTIHTTTRIEKAGGGMVARGGIFEGPRGFGVPVRIGEAGPEAVVPLNRNLAQVDPAVRYLSAIAQGLAAPKMAAGGTVGGGKQINASGWTIVTQTKDPAAVAHEVVNQLVATGY